MNNVVVIYIERQIPFSKTTEPSFFFCSIKIEKAFFAIPTFSYIVNLSSNFSKCSNVLTEPSFRKLGSIGFSFATYSWLRGWSDSTLASFMFWIYLWKSSNKISFYLPYFPNVSKSFMSLSIYSPLKNTSKSILAQWMQCIGFSGRILIVQTGNDFFDVCFGSQA